MDILLGRVTQQAMNYAIRSGVTITAGYAFKQCGRLLKEAPRGKEREELMQLQLRLESKIRIISPAIDMIDLIAARGNTSLESAVSLTKEIRYDMQRLGTRLSDAANDEGLLKRKSSRAKSREEIDRELRLIINQIKALLVRIEDAVPLINLAITTSGVNLSTKLSGTISPSRLLQASTFLTSADSQYAAASGSRAQVGPTYTISMYMLFAGHTRPVDEDGIRQTTWKEIIHKAKVKLVRLPLDCLYDLPGEKPKLNGGANTFRESHRSAEFAYQLVLIEDLDDDRVHTFEDGDPQPGPFDEVSNAGIRDVIPIHEISKVFYADTGKILNIGSDGETSSPILLLKRDVHADPPRRMLQRSQSMERGFFDEDDTDGGFDGDVATDDQSEIEAQIRRESAPNTPLNTTKSADSRDHNAAWRLPGDLDPEWIALEVFSEEQDSEDESDDVSDLPSQPTASRQGSLDPALTGALSDLNLRSPSAATSSTANGQLVPSRLAALQLSPNKRPRPQIKTSLSLLEMLMELAALQQFRQESHLAIEDELLNFFLEDSATAGAGADKQYRQRLRHNAVKRVGFDPYDESPIKRRGEDYIQHARGAASPRPGFDVGAFTGHLPDDNGYSYDDSPGYVQPSVEGPSYSPDATPSSPSPRPQPLRQTSSRGSTPVASSEIHRKEVQAKYAASRPASQASALATPPSTTRSRQAFLRSQSETKPRSPLGREPISRQGDEGIGTSPSSADLEGVTKD